MEPAPIQILSRAAFDLMLLSAGRHGVASIREQEADPTGAGCVGEHPGGGRQGEIWRGRHEGKHVYMAPVGPLTQPNRLGSGANLKSWPCGANGQR
jgi:hypothetical protein